MTFETPEPIAATIVVVIGDVRISAGDRATTVVEVHPSDATNGEDRKAAEQTVVEYADGQLLVKAPKLRSWLPRQHRRVGRRDDRAAGGLAPARRRAAGGLPLRRPARRVPGSRPASAASASTGPAR